MLSINESDEWLNDVCNECLVSMNQVNDVIMYIMNV